MFGKRANEIVWIDLDNSPHVLFFRPIIRELRARGVEVWVTARDSYQVKDLMAQLGVEGTVIGRHYGKSKLFKVAGTLYRALLLTIPAIRRRPVLAVNHGSRSQNLTSRLLGIRSVAFGDYEHSNSSQPFRATLQYLPEVLYGAGSNRPARVRAYPGLKEDAYLPDFVPDLAVIEDLELSLDILLVTFRPPATEAHYHSSRSESLFARVMRLLCQRDDIQIVLLPRNERQKVFLEQTWQSNYPNKIVIPPKAVDGLSLMWYSDLVISGGGTMNREAACLGIPVYSVFGGRLGAVDNHLSQQGRLVLLRDADCLEERLNLVRRSDRGEAPARSRRTLNFIVDEIQALVSETRTSEVPA